MLHLILGQTYIFALNVCLWSISLSLCDLAGSFVTPSLSLSLLFSLSLCIRCLSQRPNIMLWGHNVTQTGDMSVGVYLHNGERGIVCMCVYVFFFVCVYVWSVCFCVNVSIYVEVYVHMHDSLNKHTKTWVWLETYRLIHSPTHSNTHKHTPTHTYKHTPTQTHTHHIFLFLI